MGIIKKVKRKLNKHCWCSLYGTKSEEMYKKNRQLLDEAGIDYRVWMDENEPGLVFCRNYFEDPVKYRRHYNFYVRSADYKEGCRILNLDDGGLFGGISALFFLL